VAEIKLSSAARRDLARIDEFSAAQFGDDVADDYLRGLNAAFELLKRHPKAGQLRRDYGKVTRCKVYRSHRILYRLEGDTVFVQRILHHSQHVPNHLQ
jgi:toxin ParE1/3/4